MLYIAYGTKYGDFYHSVINEISHSEEMAFALELGISLLAGGGAGFAAKYAAKKATSLVAKKFIGAGFELASDVAMSYIDAVPSFFEDPKKLTDIKAHLGIVDSAIVGNLNLYK